MSDHGPTRLETELELLEAMYPDQTHYDPKSRELKFSHDNHASLLLRLPESTYLRTRVKVAVKDVGLAEGEEALDAIVAAFQQVVESAPATSDANSDTTAGANDNTSKTVIQRRLLYVESLSLVIPVFSSTLVRSIAVTEHVNDLKAKNWQAFQVRYEDEELWHFAHGMGVIEVESMSQVVKDVETEGAIGNTQKEKLLKAIGIR
ncbi:unnamed protein product [Alternaria alternata]